MDCVRGELAEGSVNNSIGVDEMISACLEESGGR